MQSSETEKGQTRETMVGASLFFTQKGVREDDRILNIDKIPFNSDDHKKALTLGPCRRFYLAKFREDVLRLIPIHRPRPGGWTPKTKPAHPSDRSYHLFFLYLGMAPVTYRIDYLDFQYGQLRGSRVLDKLSILSQYGEWNAEILERECDAYSLRSLKKVLCMEMGRSDKGKNTSLDDIVANRELLLKLKEKELDYVTDIFVPKLLRIIASTPPDKIVDTTDLRSLDNWYLTNEGFARWKFVIENNLEFIPLKNFEHLNLSLEQQVLLKKILEERVQSSPPQQPHQNPIPNSISNVGSEEDDEAQQTAYSKHKKY